MKRLLFPIVFGLVASSASAQPRPYFYLTALPVTGAEMPNLAEASVVVLRFVDLGPSGWGEDPGPDWIAEQVKQLADSQKADHLTDKDHVCIELLNFGAPTKSVDIPGHPELDVWRYETSFLDENDPIVPTPDWSDPFNPPRPTDPIRFMHPWLGSGTAKMRAWMREFLDHYYAIGGLTPVRFHFDIEFSLIGFHTVNDVRVLIAIAQDTRWGSTPVPGFEPSTMQDLYQEAIGRYHWPNESLRQALINVQNDPPGLNDSARPYFMWYTMVCQKAVDAVMNETAYHLIHEKYPGCRVSNYADCYADGKEDTFGWYDGAPWRDPDHTHQGLTKHAVRGQVTIFGDSNDNWWGDLIDYSDPWAPHGERWSQYYTPSSVASGDFSAPVLYTVWDAFLYGPQRHRVNPYRPATTPDGRNNNIFLQEASLFAHRRTMESVLNSDPPVSPGNVVPWIMAIGQVTDPSVPLDHAVSQIEMVNRLAMLRAKRNEEVLVFFWDHLAPNGQGEWNTLQHVIEQVYDPQLESFKVLQGAIPVPDNRSVDALRDTLKDPPGGLQTIDIPALGVVGGPSAAAIEGDFDGFLDANGYLRVTRCILNLECSVSELDVHGSVWAWDQSLNGGVGDWTKLIPPYTTDPPLPETWTAWDFCAANDPGCQYKGEFGFWAPADPDQSGGLK